MVVYYKDGYKFDTNTHNNKKYKVCYNNKLIYFGDKRYQQYYDKLGHYSHLNHLDKQRRQNFKNRHKNDNYNNPNYSSYWSYRYLW